MLAFCLALGGCSSSNQKVTYGTYFEKASLRRSHFSPMMVIPGKFTVFRLEARDMDSGFFNRTKFIDTFFIRFPEEVKEGLVLEENFKSGTAYYVCYSSFATWRVAPGSDSSVRCTVLKAEEDSILLEVELNVQVVSNRRESELKSLEKNRRPIRARSKYLLMKKNVHNLPRL
jgi:hypothetical protein